VVLLAIAFVVALPVTGALDGGRGSWAEWAAALGTTVAVAVALALSWTESRRREAQSRNADLDETRRLLYTALLNTEAGAEVWGTVANALVHRSERLSGREALDLATAHDRSPQSQVAIAQVILDLTEQLGEPPPSWGPALPIGIDDELVSLEGDRGTRLTFDDGSWKMLVRHGDSVYGDEVVGEAYSSDFTGERQLVEIPLADVPAEVASLMDLLGPAFDGAEFIHDADLRELIVEIRQVDPGTAAATVDALVECHGRIERLPPEVVPLHGGAGDPPAEEQTRYRRRA
jgi:hypothetical protein